MKKYIRTESGRRGGYHADRPPSPLVRGTSVPQWDLMRAFLALHRHGDYALASELEQIDDSTLRRRIRALEKHFGRTLFVRSDGFWTIASDLEELVSSALTMEEAAIRFSRTPGADAGVVRITMLDAFAQRFSSVFVALRAAHPRLQLNITTEAHFVNLEKDMVDIALRLARPVRGAGSLRIRKIGDVSVNAYASREYMKRRGSEACSTDLTEHELLVLNTEFAHQDHNVAYANLDWSDFGLRGKVVSRTDSFMVLTRMCEAGQGVAIIPTALAGAYDGLSVVRPERPDINVELWMISRLDPRVCWQRDLADLLQAEVKCWSQKPQLPLQAVGARSPARTTSSVSKSRAVA